MPTDERAFVISALEDAGYTPESVNRAVLSNNLALLIHPGHYGVQIPNLRSSSMLTNEDANNQAQDLLYSPLYEQAFNKAMTGNEVMMTGEERDILIRAKELTNTQGPGFPMPARLDHTR